MVNLGEVSLNDYLAFPVQAHNTSGNAANLDSTGSFQINIFEDDPADSGGPTQLGGASDNFDTQLDDLTGLYAYKTQLTAAKGFSAGKRYFARVGEGLVDGKTPATLYSFYVLSDGASLNEQADELMALQSNLVNHGDSTWLTATGFSTPANIIDAKDDIINHGDSSWSGSAEATIIAAAVWNRQSSDNQNNQFEMGYLVDNIHQALFNRRELDTTDDIEILYDRNGDSSVSWPITDPSGSGISLASGIPARRGTPNYA